MKYLKTFESYNQADDSLLNSAEGKKIQDKIDSMSPQDLAKLEAEVAALADKLGLSLEEMKDAEKVSQALVDSGMADKIESMIPVKESFSEWWSRTKDKFYNLLWKLGLGGLLTSLASICVGAEMVSSSTALADFVPDATVHPHLATVVGGVGMAVSLVTTIVGLKKSGKMD